MVRSHLKKYLCIVFALTSVSCSKSASEESSVNVETRDVFAMDTYMSMKAYGDNAGTALSEAESFITQLESDLSVTNEKSCISKVNSAYGASTEVTKEAAEMIQKAAETGKNTDGALDITIYPLLKEWGFTTGEYHIPDESVIGSLLEKTGYDKIQLNGNTVTVPSGFQIDLGAVAKGYTSDGIMDIMHKNSIDSAIVSLGGNVQAIGTKPDGSLWKVAVRDPFSPDTDMCVVEIDNKAVVTSGNYERFFTGDDGRNYWHIIDPSDGYPADNGLVSVTVIGDSGLECDALSTALFVLGDGKAQDYWENHSGFDMILVTDDKRMIYTEGIKDRMNIITDMKTEVLSFD